MISDAPSELKVMVDPDAVRIFTDSRFKIFRHLFPILALLGTYWFLGFPPMSFVELLVLAIAITGICTITIRYAALALLRKRNPEQATETLLDLSNGILQLYLDDINESMRLEELVNIKVSRKRWWIAPHLAFKIERIDGYTRAVETSIDLPELRHALITLSDEVIPAHRQADPPPSEP